MPVLQHTEPKAQEFEQSESFEQPPEPEPEPDEPDEPDDPELPELAHAPIVVSQVDDCIVQSTQVLPPAPQVVSAIGWQVPVPSQQPVGHVPGPQALPPPLLVPLVVPLLPLVEPVLPDASSPGVTEPLEPLLPLEPPPSNGPSPGPASAHAKERAATESATTPKGGRRPRKCILPVYLPALALQAIPGARAPRDGH